MDARKEPVYRADHNQEIDAIVEAVLAGTSESIENAEGVPAAGYTSRAVFDLEVKKIFRKDWICVGHVSQVPHVGDYFTIDMFGESLVIVRGTDRISVLSRLCLHRWAEVVRGVGNTKSFLCPFHNWAYALDGRLINAPFMDKAKNFEPKNCRLPEVKSEIVEDLGFIFVTFADEIDSICERLADLSERLANYRVNELTFVEPSGTDCAFNWKFQIETGVEAYHHFGTHRDTLGPIYPTRMS